jgi:HEAT repeat protein
MNLPEDLLSADVQRRRQAAANLAQNGVQSASVTALIRAAGDEDEVVREWAVSALEDMGAPDASLLMGMVEMLDEPNEDIAYWAVTLLGRLGKPAAPAVAKLGSMVCSQRSLAVRQRAAWALQQIGPDAADALAALQMVSQSDDARLAPLARAAIDAICRK